MSEERKMILNMLKEGRISVEEADQLLGALAGQPEKPKDEGPLKQAGPKFEQFVSSISSLVETVAQQVGPALEQKLEGLRSFSKGSTNRQRSLEQQSFVVEPDVTRLELENPYGKIHIRGHEEDNVLLEVEKHIEAKSEELAEELAAKYKIGRERENHSLRFCFPDPASLAAHKVSFDLSLHVPKRLALHLMTQQRDITVLNMQALESNQIKSQSGDIYLQTSHFEQLALETRSGNIYADQIDGQLLIKTASGDIRLTGKVVDGQIATASGRVEIECRVGQKLLLEAESGDIALHLLEATSGEIGLSSGSGDIEFRGPVNGDVRLNSASGDLEGDISLQSGSLSLVTHSGDVEFTLNPQSQCTLDAQTRSGGIECRHVLQDQAQTSSSLKGKLGSGDGLLKIETLSGDITLL